MLDNSNRIPNTVISKTFVAELIRDLCHFAANLGQSDGQKLRHQCLPSLSDRTKLLHELCECEPQLMPYLIAEFKPIFRAIVDAFASHFDGPPNAEMAMAATDQILCHFLAVVSSLLCFDFGSFFEDISGVDRFLSLCFASIGQMNANSMAITLNCLVRFLSSLRSSVPSLPSLPFAVSSVSLRVVAHYSVANFSDFAVFVLQNSLNSDLICSLWQFLHAMSADEITAVALSDFVPSLVPLISADPSILSQKFPRAPIGGGGEKKPLPMLTLSNLLLHNSALNSADCQQISALLQKEIGKETEEKEKEGTEEV
ncbi:hypothetical protein niasHT_036865 [Heterodera trifolii]|uniref:Uncharacterized protein n=1 Tax=Heterodera trifolii TaxID=157864 RepID=A0ABD2I8M3_9BILA